MEKLSKCVKASFRAVFGMFMGSDGIMSSTKIFAFLGYISFLVVSAYVVYAIPEKFNFEIFALMTAGTSTSLRAVDKYLNIRNREISDTPKCE